MAMFAATEDKAGGLSRLERQFRGDYAVSAAANAVGAKIFASHVPPPPAITSGDINPFRVMSTSKNIQ
jgi:hypothetical protein